MWLSCFTWDIEVFSLRPKMGRGAEDPVCIQSGHTWQKVARLVTVHMFYSRSAAC